MTWNPDPLVGPRVAALLDFAGVDPPSRGPGCEPCEPGDVRRVAPAIRGSSRGAPLDSRWGGALLASAALGRRGGEAGTASTGSG